MYKEYDEIGRVGANSSKALPGTIAAISIKGGEELAEGVSLLNR